MTKVYIPLALRNYTPVLTSMPALPIDDVCEDPVCVQFSAALIPYLVGLLEIYRWPDKFHGSPDEVQKSLGIIQDLVSILVEAEMCCCNPEPVLHQITADGDMQVSYDGGVTWVQDPEDPRVTGTQLPPLPGAPGDDKRCSAAAKVVEQMQDKVSGFSGQLGQGNNAIQLAAQIAIILVALVLTAGTAAAIIVPIIITLAAALINYTKAEYDNLFSQAAWDDMLCILYCEALPDGSYNKAQWNNIKAKIDTKFSGDLALTFYSIINGWGVVMLNNAARLGTATADCSTCECAGCDLTGWSVFTGTEDVPARTDTSITVTAVPYSGGYAIRVIADDINDCCCYMSYEIISGTTAITVIAWNECGVSNTDDTYLGFSYSGQNTNLYYLYANAPFKAKVFSTGDCPP